MLVDLNARKKAKKRENVLITGGVRGLGLILATKYAARGASVAICSRTESEHEAALEKIRAAGDRHTKAFAYRCDVGSEKEVESLVKRATKDLGQIDVLVNAAGVILSAPLGQTVLKDFKETVQSNLWGAIHSSLAVVPQMSLRGSGKIVNITSVGGLFPVPHLSAYSVSKFGAVGFSTALSVELAKKGIEVVTVAPTLMRTGSFLRARFRGVEREEMKLFTKVSTLFGMSVSAEWAAEQIMKAADRGKPFAVIGWNAKIARLGFALFPNLTLRALRMVSERLPDTDGDLESLMESEGIRHAKPPAKTGAEIQSETGLMPQTKTGQKAAEKWNEIPSVPSAPVH